MEAAVMKSLSFLHKSESFLIPTVDRQPLSLSRFDEKDKFSVPGPLFLKVLGKIVGVGIGRRRSAK